MILFKEYPVSKTAYEHTLELGSLIIVLFS